MNEKVEEILYRENLKVASFQKRVFAYLIDDVLISLLFFVMFFGSFYQVAGDREALISLVGTNFLYLVLLRGAYQSLFTYFYGASIGKILLKIRVVEIDTLDNPNWLNAIVRSFFRELGQSLFYITFFFALNDAFVRTLHDRIVKTIVIVQDSH